MVFVLDVSRFLHTPDGVRLVMRASGSGAAFFAAGRVCSGRQRASLSCGLKSPCAAKAARSRASPGRQISKMSSGNSAETSGYGTSTASEILRSTAALQSA
jgi:hypothetical protein